MDLAHEFHESLVTHASRLKADSENVYNLCMRVRMSNLTSEQLEIFRDIEQRLYKMHEFCVSIIKEEQK